MEGGVPFADSRNVAEVFGKEHFNVLRDIDTVLTHASDLRGVEFQELSTVHPTVPGRSIRHFHMTKDGFTLLVMGYTGPKAMAFKLAYIRRFNEMEQALREAARPAPEAPRELSRMELLKLAVEAEEGRLVLQKICEGPLIYTGEADAPLGPANAHAVSCPVVARTVSPRRAVDGSHGRADRATAGLACMGIVTLPEPHSRRRFRSIGSKPPGAPQRVTGGHLGSAG